MKPKWSKDTVNSSAPVKDRIKSTSSGINVFRTDDVLTFVCVILHLTVSRDLLPHLRAERPCADVFPV